MQECDSKGVIGAEWGYGRDGEVGRRVRRGSTTHDSLDLMICQYRYLLVLFELGVRTGGAGRVVRLWVTLNLNPAIWGAIAGTGWRQHPIEDMS